jgi:hypothetical protein
MLQINASIVVFHNNHDQLKKAINSILTSDFLMRLYLVDNSSNKEYEQFSAMDKRIVYISNGVNYGYGKAHNIAIRRTMSDNIPYHIVLNPDVYFKKGTIEKIYLFMEDNQDVGLVMPKVLYPDGSLQYLCKLIPTPFDLFGRRFLRTGFLKRIIKDNDNRFELRFTGYDRLMNVPYLSGCFMFLRISALKEIGAFDERFFMYPEDIDLTRRIHEKYKTIYYPEVSIIHDHARESYYNIKMLRIHIINMIRYFNKWGWIIDKKRKTYNQRLLEELGYYKS